MVEFREILARARRGDPLAIEALYAEFSAPVLQRIRQRLPRRLGRYLDDADMAQAWMCDRRHPATSWWHGSGFGFHVRFLRQAQSSISRREAYLGVGSLRKASGASRTPTMKEESDSMNERTKLVLSLAALGLAAMTFHEARAGNIGVVIPATSVQYFSLEIPLGGSVKYTGSIPDVVWLIDDITYAVDLDPCTSEDRCELFDIAAIRSCWDPILQVPPANGWVAESGVCDPGHQVIERLKVPMFNDYYRDFSIARWSHARGAVFRAGLSNGAAGQVYGPYFDRVSHTIYGQMLARQLMSDGVKIYEGPPDPGSTYRDTAYGIGLGLGITAVNTSESRHYQTPEIVPVGTNPPTTGNVVGFHSGDGYPCSAENVYTCAWVSIKGRLITQTTDVPVINYSDFPVTGP